MESRCSVSSKRISKTTCWQGAAALSKLPCFSEYKSATASRTLLDIVRRRAERIRHCAGGSGLRVGPLLLARRRALSTKPAHADRCARQAPPRGRCGEARPRDRSRCPLPVLLPGELRRRHSFRNGHELVALPRDRPAVLHQLLLHMGRVTALQQRGPDASGLLQGGLTAHGALAQHLHGCGHSAVCAMAPPDQHAERDTEGKIHGAKRLRRRKRI